MHVNVLFEKYAMIYTARSTIIARVYVSYFFFQNTSILIDSNDL